MSGNDAEKNKDANQILEQSLTKLAWLVNINAKDLAKKHEKEEKGRSVNKEKKITKNKLANI